MTPRRLLLPALFLGLGFAPEAHAADITSSVGLPGSTDWENACGLPRTEPPASRSELFDCDTSAYPEAACLHRVDIDTSPGAFPQATCGDGTPATFYIREGVGDLVNRWVIHLEGGAGCRDHASCLARWCGADGFYTAEKMSSDWDADGTPNLPDHAFVLGIPTILPDNEFSGWTHVYIPYCSSDAWLGQASDVTFADGSDSLDLDMRGHSILQAVRRMLRQKAPGAGWTAQDGYTVPDIDDAVRILFTGTSAGGVGAVQNADWFLDPFDDSVNGLVVDAALDPLNTALSSSDVWIDLDDDGIGDTEYAPHRRSLLQGDWAPGGLFEQIDAFVDESCRASQEPLGRMDRCSLTSKILKLNSGGGPMIETQTFVRQDLEDNAIGGNHVAMPTGETLLVGGSTGTPMTIEDYAVIMRETIVALYDDHDSVTGAYAPKCGKHVGLPRLLAFGADTTSDTDGSVSPAALIAGTASTFHDALDTWFGIGGVFVDTRHIDTDEPGVTFSTCY